MYRLKDYEGPVDYDMELIELCQRHLHQAADPDPGAHMSMIIRCDQATWDRLGDETQIKAELAKNEWEVREMRDDLKVEAIKCFHRHGAPNSSKGCPDYEDSSKTIGRTVGVPMENRQYLCHFCPFQSHVTHVLRKKKGMYD
jgi:hypothetical protein